MVCGWSNHDCWLDNHGTNRILDRGGVAGHNEHGALMVLQRGVDDSLDDSDGVGAEGV